jgi:[ribosomal protein S5]-alanine N-acetyltransferase
VIFETLRLVARRITIQDVPAMHAVYGDEVAMRFVGDGVPLPVEGCVRWVAVTDANFVRYGHGMIALEEKATGEAVGFIGIVHPGGQPEPEVKYAFRRDKWGQGLATEALRGLVEYADRELLLPFLTATTHPDNEVSARILRGAGFQTAEDRVEESGDRTAVWMRRRPSESA